MEEGLPPKHRGKSSHSCDLSCWLDSEKPKRHEGAVVKRPA